MNKKGFFSVYACLFLVVLLAAAGIFIASAKKSAVNGTARACSRLWSQSILAEYDQNLQNCYHVFGYYGYPSMVKEKLEFYGKETFGEKNNVDLQFISCDLYHHSLRNINVFQRQINAWGKLSLAEENDEETLPIAIKGVTHHQKPDKQVLFSDLPSDGCKTGFSISGLIDILQGEPVLTDLVKKGSDTYFQMNYIFSHFKDQCHPRNLSETYLQSETEYIIGGKNSDIENEKAVKKRIIALREAMNLSYLKNCPEKLMAVQAAAVLVNPGAAEVTAQSILAAWAYAESINDYHLLLEGYPVASVKTDDSWATGLDAVLETDGVEGCIYTGIEKGGFYEDYLRLFLFSMNTETRLLRMMDLIQINMRYLYYDSFLIGDYYGGISYTYNINGETCHVEETYE
ncbi:MAG: hypothetical protein IKK48_06235 [Firmicutes bacterium]|nr:hypothetical protein [Bacillota bacterium]